MFSKGAVKAISKAVKELSDSQLEEYQNTGKITVAGHELVEGDLKLMYKFDSSKEGAKSSYDAHSDKEVMVQRLDLTVSQLHLF